MQKRKRKERGRERKRTLFLKTKCTLCSVIDALRKKNDLEEEMGDTVRGLKGDQDEGRAGEIKIAWPYCKKARAFCFT